MNDVLQNKKLVIAEDVLDKCIGEYQQKASAQKSIKGKTEGTKFYKIQHFRPGTYSEFNYVSKQWNHKYNKPNGNERAYGTCTLTFFWIK